MPVKHIIITGTGRAGTTFLIELINEMGEDCGPIKKEKNDFEKEKRAGKEWRLYNLEDFDRSPRVLKSPSYVHWLKKAHDKIEHLIVPVRDLGVVVKSRVGEHLFLEGPRDSKSQEKEAAYMLGLVVEAMVIKDIPTTFAKFPKMVESYDYLWNKLSPIFPSWELEDFKKAFKMLAEPEMIKYA